MAYLDLADGGKLYYEIEGSGKPVVFIHGWKANSDVYLSTTKRLKDTFTCIRYDQYGHMRSVPAKKDPTIADLADNLKEVVDKLCPEKPVLVGWSMGAATIMEYIGKYGCEKTASVILVDYGPKMRNDDDWKHGALSARLGEEKLDEFVKLAKTDFDRFLDHYYENTNPSYAPMDKENREAFRKERMQGQDSEIIASLWESLNETDYREVLPKISVPTAIFHAGRWPVCTEGAAAYYKDHIPAPVRLVKFENATHAIMVDEPEMFAEEIRDFIENKE